MKFTIVMTVYQREELTLHAIYSVLQQDYEDWELFIIADGPHPSVEENVRLIREDKYHAFWGSDPSVASRIHYEEHFGTVHGTFGNPLRRRGLMRATGDYICFLSHDCLLDKDYLSSHGGNIYSSETKPCVSVVSVLYWTADPSFVIDACGAEAAEALKIPAFIGKIPWGEGVGAETATGARSGQIDLTCLCFPVEESRQVGVFSSDMDFTYDADYRSYNKLRAIIPVVFSSRVCAGHF